MAQPEHDPAPDQPDTVTSVEATRPRSIRTYGRHVRHDPRSLAYAVGVLPKSALQSVDWTRRIPVLDQGNVGSCTANAAVGALGTDSAGRTATTTVTITEAGAARSHGLFTAGTYQLDEAFALRLYSLETILDGYPGTYPPIDTGSNGVGAGKALQALGLITKYTHAFSLAAARSALQAGPIIIGVHWYASMESTDTDGRIPIVKASGLAGGHEVEIPRWDSTLDRFWITNSWGAGWGLDGRGYLTGTDLQTLLSEEGDVTAFTWATPTPPTPVPLPAPQDADHDLLTAMTTWRTRKGI